MVSVNAVTAMIHTELFSTGKNKWIVSCIVGGAAGAAKLNQSIVEQRSGFVVYGFETLQEIAAVAGQPAIVIAPVLPFG